MNHLTIALCLLALAGCADTKYIIKPEPVDVKFPVLYCPPTDEIAPMTAIELETLKLTPADKANPGKVARAYEIDMITLTQRQSELNRIEEQRRADATKTKEMLEKYQAEVARIHKENIDKVAKEAVEKQKALNKQ